ncbi:MAG: zinc-dependent alcohol dehydrogenase family protein [Chloroflexi bacterium]|nr:zinc-dependent alcohol dehydrogenase family protein [Chloroflexota bacterium]
MRAVVFPAPGQVEVRQVPDPTPGPSDVVIRVARCGICGTDLHIFRDEYASRFPLIPGHECVGTVVALGRDVTDLQPGWRVAVDPNIACGACSFCRERRFNQCQRWRVLGVTEAGAFAEYLVAPARVCFPVPDAIDDAAAAWIEPLACVAHAMARLPVETTARALVFGAGPIGLLLAQALRLRGALDVTIVERRTNRLALARRLGLGAVVAADDDLAAQLREQAPDGFAIVADATGAPTVIEHALAYVRSAGHYLQFGVAPRDALVRWNPYDIFRREISIIGSFALNVTVPPAIAWLERGLIQTAALTSHTVDLDGFATALDAFAAGETLKVHVQP